MERLEKKLDTHIKQDEKVHDEIHEEIRVIRDNHLAHLKADLSDVKIDVATVKNDVSWIKKNWWILVTAVIGAIAAGLVNIFIN